MRVSESQHTYSPTLAVGDLRSQLGHPIIDGDGHLAEFMPWFAEILRDVGGQSVAERLKSLSFALAIPGSGVLPARTFHTVPTRNTLDRMTTMLPHLHYKRLDEFGIDYALLYPSYGLLVLSAVDDELRQAAARAYNTYVAAAYDGLRDRLEPVAVIPTFTPNEAITELDHAVGVLGLKAIVLTGVVPRSVRPDGTVVPWIDTLGHDSLYDYDPFWARCEQLGVTPAFHGIGYGWGSRVSPTNYVYNHLGSFAAAQEAVCRSLVMGGVPQRFPNLHFSFLEGGVAWACALLLDLLSHYEKRNATAVSQYDPRELDVEFGADLLDEFGDVHMRARREKFIEDLKLFAGQEEADTDDFASAGVRAADDIIDIFSRQFSFGCEADDSMTALAFDNRVLPEEVQLRAMFASDIGHWDVPDARLVLAEAAELLTEGRMDQTGFRRLMCDNIAQSLLATNRRFFQGTALAEEANRLLVNSSWEARAQP